LEVAALACSGKFTEEVTGFLHISGMGGFSGIKPQGIDECHRKEVLFSCHEPASNTLSRNSCQLVAPSQRHGVVMIAVSLMP
jgi:hypothetical protein